MTENIEDKLKELAQQAAQVSDENVRSNLQKQIDELREENITLKNQIGDQEEGKCYGDILKEKKINIFVPKYKDEKE
jgi:hypothetical protein